MKADVLVIGAGPAGSAAATTLARAGARVALVEKSTFPRAKACGEGLTPRAVSAIEGLGVSLQEAPRVGRVCVRSWFTPPESAALDFLEPGGRTLPRSELDLQMVQLASAAGAELLDETLVRELVLEEGHVKGARLRSSRGATEAVEAPVTILCEGSNGPLARQLPVPTVRGRQTAYAVRRYVENVDWGSTAALEVFLPIAAHGLPLVGYAWAFPLSHDSANIGIGFLSEAGKAAALSDHLDRFQEMLSRSDPRFERCKVASDLLGAPIAIGGAARSCFGPGVLLAGDTAGLANPFWAEGISHAVESGMLAGTAALRCLDEGLPLSSYGSSLTDRNPTFGRIAASLPTIYRNVKHLAHDLAPFLATQTDVSRAFFQMADVEPTPSSLGSTSSPSDTPLDAAAAAAAQRAHRLAARARPLFGEILARLDALPKARPSLALAFLVGAEGRTRLNSRSNDLHRGAVCLELIRLSAHCLLDLPTASSTTPEQEGRGGPWLSSTISLHLADGLMARAIFLCSRVQREERQPLADAIHQIFLRAQCEMGSSDSPGSSLESFWTQSVGIAAAAGARIAGATLDDAQKVGGALAEAAAQHHCRASAVDYFDALQRELSPSPPTQHAGEC